MNQDNGGIIGKINTPTTLVASGVWTLQDQFEAQSSSTWPLAFPQTTIANSCRFNNDSSDYLIRTPSGASNRDAWTLSLWIKRCNLGSYQSIYGIYADANNQENFGFDDSDRFFWQLYQSGSAVGQLTSNRVFRDTSAWYNIVAVYDSANSTAGNRMRLYINSVEETSFATDTNPSSGLDSLWNSTTAHSIGRINTTNYIDMYLAEFIHVDGQVLTPTSFGATNPVTNIWEPIAYTGTYGTNGFKLNFADSSNLGDDTSGNGNDFTVNNLTSIDQSTDTCSNNFATMNSLYKLSNVTFSEGNLQHTNAGNWQPGLSTIGVSSGKWYFESKFTAVTGGSNNAFIGISLDTEADGLTLVGNSANSYGYENTGQKKNNSSSASYGDSWTVGDIVSCYVDLDNGAIYFGKNGTVQASGDPTSGSTKTNAAYTFTTGGTYLLGVSDYYGTQQVNYGSPPFSISSGNADANGFGNFEYAVPSGYFALNTKNLSEFG